MQTHDVNVDVSRPPRVAPIVDSILVSRLKRFIDPFNVLFLEEESPLNMKVRQIKVQYPAVSNYVAPELRWEFKKLSSQVWHIGRVRYFIDQLEAGKQLDPIDVDNACDRGFIYQPILVDGHHRFCAAILVGKRRIPVHYSGRMDTLRWLTGARRNAPGDL